MEQTMIEENRKSFENEVVKNEGKNALGYVLNIVIATFGLFVISLLLNISDKVANYNKVAGIVTFVVLLILFLFFYVRPILSIVGMEYFETGANTKNVKAANAHNVRTRKNIAKRIISMKQTAEGSEWYDSRLVESLKVAVDNKNDGEIYKRLKVLMEKSIKKTSNKIIVKSAVQSGVYTALVPSQQLDALLVATVNFKMVKDILFLYGYRPTNARLIKIYVSSISASLAAYNLQGSGVGSFITRALSRLPLVKGPASYVADATTQALANGAFTMLIGYKAIDYLKREYNLQILIDNVDVLDDEQEFENTKKQVEEEISKKVKLLKK